MIPAKQHTKMQHGKVMINHDFWALLNCQLTNAFVRINQATYEAGRPAGWELLMASAPPKLAKKQPTYQSSTSMNQPMNQSR